MRINIANNLYRYTGSAGAFYRIAGLVTTYQVSSTGSLYVLNAGDNLLRFSASTGGFILMYPSIVSLPRDSFGLITAHSSGGTVYEIAM